MNSTDKLPKKLSETLLHTLMESVDDLFFVIGRDGRYLMINGRGLKSCGYSLDDVIGKKPSEIFDEQMSKRFEENNSRVIQSGQPLVTEEWLNVLGEKRCYSTLLTPILDDKGRVEAVLGISRNITDLKRMMEELQIYAGQLETLFKERVHSERLIREIIKEALTTKSIDEFLQTITYMLGESMNVSRVYIFKYDQIRKNASTTHEWVAKGIRPTKDEMQDVPVTAQPWWSYEMLAGRIICINDSSQTKSPELKELLQSQNVKSTLAIPIFTFEQPYGFIGFDECKSVRKWEPMDIDLLGGVARIIAQKLERYRLEEDMLGMERLAATGRLAASFTHEINNPLQSILLHLADLDHHVNKKGKHKLEAVNKGIKQITGMVSRLLNVYKERHEISDIDINSLLNDAYKLISRSIHLKGISVRWMLKPDLPTFSGDARKLHQVFLNVMLNALDGMSDGGDLMLATFNEQCHIAIDIRDTGCGIDEDALPYIFEPFYTSKEGKGTGLGLFISHSIIQEHNGQIKVQSKKGQGTNVTIILPLTASCKHLNKTRKSLQQSNQERET